MRRRWFVNALVPLPFSLLVAGVTVAAGQRRWAGLTLTASLLASLLAIGSYERHRTGVRTVPTRRAATAGRVVIRSGPRRRQERYVMYAVACVFGALGLPSAIRDPAQAPAWLAIVGLFAFGPALLRWRNVIWITPTSVIVRLDLGRPRSLPRSEVASVRLAGGRISLIDAAGRTRLISTTGWAAAELYDVADGLGVPSIEVGRPDT